jgi:hypothetical protein
MLNKDPVKRIKIKEALDHEFFNDFMKEVRPKNRIVLDVKQILSQGLIKMINKKRVVNVEIK